MNTRTVGAGLRRDAAAVESESKPRRRKWIPGMPMEVALAYSAALNVSTNTPVMYKIALLRVLEQVFAHQEAGGDGILERIDHLCECGTVPKGVSRLAHELRDSGMSPSAPPDEEPGEKRTFEDLVVAILDHAYAEPLRAGGIKRAYSRSRRLL